LYTFNIQRPIIILVNNEEYLHGIKLYVILIGWLDYQQIGIMGQDTKQNRTKQPGN
jgi:hypothetical protein